MVGRHGTQRMVCALASPFVMPLFMLIAVRLVGCERKPARKPRLCAASMAIVARLMVRDLMTDYGSRSFSTTTQFDLQLSLQGAVRASRATSY